MFWKYSLMLLFLGLSFFVFFLKVKCRGIYSYLVNFFYGGGG